MGVARSREPGSNADTASECAIHVLRSCKCTCPNTTGTIQSYRRPAWKTADAWLPQHGHSGFYYAFLRPEEQPAGSESIASIATALERRSWFADSDAQHRQLTVGEHWYQGVGALILRCDNWKQQQRSCRLSGLVRDKADLVGMMQHVA